MNEQSATLGGSRRHADLLDLIERLRGDGFHVSASEAIDAARLLAHMGQDPDSPAELAALRTRLRPVLCKSQPQQGRFDAVFKDWVQQITQHWEKTQAFGPAPEPEKTSVSPTPSVHRRGGKWRIAGFIMLLALVVGSAMLVLWNPRSEPPAAPPNISGDSRDINPDAPPETAPDVGRDEHRVQGYLPAVRHNREIKTGWAWALLGIPLLLLVAVSLPGYFISRSRVRSAGRDVVLDDSPLKKEASRIVPPMEEGIADKLERHVHSATSSETPARLHSVDLKRTVQATISNFGVPKLHYRPRRLRPSYLVLIDADGAEDPRGRLFYRWAERMRLQGLNVEIHLFHASRVGTGGGGGDNAAPHPFRFTGSIAGDKVGSLAALDRLDDPPAAQRLVLVTDGAALVDDDGHWRGWARRARFSRWSDRVIFTPVEHRDWGVREQALERTDGYGGHGFLVLPLDEEALRAWSVELTSGKLPEIVLSEPQRFPRLLSGPGCDVLGDEPPAELEQLIAQLRLYLGENGFRWIAACAIPPVVRWELTLLLGERIFRHGGVQRESDLRYLISRNYRRLARLPWFRERRIPDWLRLRLLSELPRSVQDDLRSVISSLLAPLAPHVGRGLELSFDTPPGSSGAGANKNEKSTHNADVLYLGYMSGLSPRQLALRAPPAWSKWVNRVRSHRPTGVGIWRWRLRGAGEWLRAFWARLAFQGGFPHSGASRRSWVLGLGGLMVWIAGVVWIGRAGEQSWIGQNLSRETFKGVGFRHAASIGHVAFSPDGRWVATASDDGTARVWNLRTGDSRGVLRGHEGAINSVAFSPDGTRVVTASNDGSARVWDVNSGVLLGPPLRHDGRVNYAIFSPEGRLVVTASSDNAARVWVRVSDLRTGGSSGVLQGHEGAINSVAFSPDGTRVVTASDDGTARVWGARIGDSPEVLRVLRGHEGVINSVAFSPDGTRVVTASDDGTARVWSARIGDSPEVLRVLRGHEGAINSAAFSPHGRFVATASSDNTARVWDAATGTPIGAPLRHEGQVNHLAFSPDADLLATASRDGGARVWEADTGVPRDTWPLDSLPLSPRYGTNFLMTEFTSPAVLPLGAAALALYGLVLALLSGRRVHRYAERMLL